MNGKKWRGKNHLIERDADLSKEREPFSGPQMGRTTNDYLDRANPFSSRASLGRTPILFASSMNNW